MTMQPPKPIRRVVTGHDENNVAKVLIDGEATNTRSSQPGRFSTLIWSTDATPADITIGEDVEDLGARKLGTAPPAGGTRFTVNDIPPGARGAMHRTETLDYVVVLSGELDMEMDDSTVTLRAGDVMVQRGTNHSWTNRGSEYARVVFVLIDATPLNIGHPLTGMATNKTGPGSS
jgi:quercetin dioxygenase-like cupin family protein